QDFFSWYNREHHHSGIGWLTPETVHYGRAEETLTAEIPGETEADLLASNRSRDNSVGTHQNDEWA
ncbi:MAG: hypothetical protein C4527_04290, partial [Candidatus Omnitrophota bacterium]